MKNLTDLEIRRHGDLLFPFARYHMAVEKGTTALDAHWHGELEFLVMARGKAIFQMDGTEVVLEQGDGLFIGGGVLHGGDRVPGCPCVYDAAVFNPALVVSERSDLVSLRIVNPVLEAMGGKVLSLNAQGSDSEKRALAKLEEMRSLREGPYFELEIKRALLALMADVHRMLFDEKRLPLAPSGSSPRTGSIKAVIRFLDDNYREPVTLEDMTRIAVMSPSHFSRSFKAAVSMTPVEYLHSLRINAAAALLRETDRPLLHISQDVGYDSVNYFIRRFKRAMGLPPGQYRRNRR